VVQISGAAPENAHFGNSFRVLGTDTSGASDDAEAEKKQLAESGRSGRLYASRVPSRCSSDLE